MIEKKVPVVHYIIAAAFIFLFRFIPPFGGITSYGMGLLGTFIGAVYGWSTIGMLWPSLMALVGIGISVGPDNMLYASFGNVSVASFFVFCPLLEVMTQLGATEKLAISFVNNKLCKGRPWLTIYLLFLGAFFTAFINSILVIIVFCTFITGLCKQLDIKPYTKLPTTLMLGTAYAVVNGQSMVPFIPSTGMIYAQSYYGMMGEVLPSAQYLMFYIPMGVLLLLAYTLIMRFVFRVDVSPMKNMPEDKVKMTKDQKAATEFFGIFMLILVISALCPAEWRAISILNNSFGVFGVGAVFCGIMMIWKDSEGNSFLDFNKMMSYQSWDFIFLTGYIMNISAFLITEETGVGTALANILLPFMNLPAMAAVVVILLLTAIITNFASNIILAIIVMPVLGSYAAQVGLNPMGISMVILLCSQMSLLTAGASPVIGITHTFTQTIKPVDITRQALIAFPILFVITVSFGLLWQGVIF